MKSLLLVIKKIAILGEKDCDFFYKERGGITSIPTWCPFKLLEIEYCVIVRKSHLDRRVLGRSHPLQSHLPLQQ